VFALWLDVQGGSDWLLCPTLLQLAGVATARLLIPQATTAPGQLPAAAFASRLVMVGIFCRLAKFRWQHAFSLQITLQSASQSRGHAQNSTRDTLSP
jgi:hypothetical protein